MTDLPPPSQADSTPNPQTDSTAESASVAQPKDSYVKLAMRNMVRKSGQSLTHFGLTTIGLVALLVGLAYLTR